LEGKLIYTKTTEDGFTLKMNERYQSSSKHETRRTTTTGKTKIMMKQVRKEVTQKEDKAWEACRRWSSGKKQTDKEA